MNKLYIPDLGLIDGKDYHKQASGRKSKEKTMAVYFCSECCQHIDDDWHPGEDVDGELVCPDCVAELQGEDALEPQNQTNNIHHPD